MFEKIGTRLILAVGIATIIIITVFAYFSVRSQNKVLLAEVERHANQCSETIKRSTKYSMLLNRREHIREAIKTIGDQPFFNEIRIFDKEGVNIISSNPASEGIMVDKKAEACYACHSENKPLEILDISKRTRIYRLHPDSSRILGIINAIYNERSCYEADCHAHDADQKVLGVLDLTVSLRTIDKQISHAKFRIIILAVVSIIALSCILWFFVWNFIRKPVRELLLATEHVAEGNLTYTIRDLGKSELGILARSFNNMLNKLYETRRQLFQSDKMASLGKLAAGVAHEINNPLTGILTYSSFLLKRAKNYPEIQEDLEIIYRETKRSGEIVKGLLNFARQSIPKKNNVNINELIPKALKVVDNQLSINKIKVNENFDKKLPNVIVDANQMTQVMINLIVNAIDAIGANGGSIDIKSSLITLEPFGVAQFKKATCPKNHSLVDNSFKIEGLPSIKLKAKYKNIEGYINIDPIYGKHRNHYGFRVKTQSEISISCPTCNISLIDVTKKCPTCGSKVYFFEVPDKGRVEGCSRKDCNWQYWENIEKDSQKEYIEISITDTGSGIEKKTMSKIFDPFYTTKGQKGTGLGLAVIWGIIDNHNGTITADSEVGKGSTFTIHLPSARSKINPA
jgi:two-component system, NtrC family, sensor kinase